MLRRFTAKRARACLQDVGPIIFLGDSVTRYQFLTLYYFILTGKYQHAFDGTKSLSNAHRHALEDAVAGGDYRYDRLWEHVQKLVHEFEPTGSLSLVHNRSASQEEAHFVLPGAEAGKKVELLYNYIADGGPEVVGRAVDWVRGRGVKPAYILLNVCAHYHGRRPSTDISKDVLGTLRWWSTSARRKLPDTQLVWKSCTTPFAQYREGVDEEEVKIVKAAKNARVAVYDIRDIALQSWRQHIIATLAPTSVHFYQFWYENFNDMLLNVLCPAAPEDYPEAGGKQA
ncbi:hypothetical protein HYH03_001418 [Edaphochlamys debaryana]|uniref:Uncharacterized protein n=1 Tax=Edaphochlamys debaryana TaxID=47281 RepID=A0A836C4Y0_9CHLO|nr:hypothetical protein HYH03_001418 [Edaphochlamys debaryana]|eukprot:KAG2500651.1 hypothetical protein HYH03_001418 [Edaphochlamys debaryana]